MGGWVDVFILEDAFSLTQCWNLIKIHSLVTRLSPALKSRAQCVVSMAEEKIPTDTQQRYVCLTNIESVEDSVGRVVSKISTASMVRLVLDRDLLIVELLWCVT